MQDCMAKRVARRFDYGQCSSIGCPRMRQYVKGCSWDRCCKLGFATDCLEHEHLCDDMHKEVKNKLKQQILEDTDDESDLDGLLETWPVSEQLDQSALERFVDKIAAHESQPLEILLSALLHLSASLELRAKVHLWKPDLMF